MQKQNNNNTKTLSKTKRKRGTGKIRGNQGHMPNGRGNH